MNETCNNNLDLYLLQLDGVEGKTYLTFKLCCTVVEKKKEAPQNRPSLDSVFDDSKVVSQSSKPLAPPSRAPPTRAPPSRPIDMSLTKKPVAAIESALQRPEPVRAVIKNPTSNNNPSSKSMNPYYSRICLFCQQGIEDFSPKVISLAADTGSIYFHENCLQCFECNFNFTNMKNKYGDPNFKRIRGGMNIIDDPLRRSKVLLCGVCHQVAMGNVCAGCGGAISILPPHLMEREMFPFNMNASYLIALDLKWHPSCFICVACLSPLSNNMDSHGAAMFCVKDDNVYCHNCYQDMFLPKCFSCSRSITGKILSLKSSSRSLQSSINDCDSDQSLTKDRKGVDVFHYHIECFQCCLCHQSLNDREVCMDDQSDSIFCLSCYHLSRQGGYHIPQQKRLASPQTNQVQNSNLTKNQQNLEPANFKPFVSNEQSNDEPSFRPDMIPEAPALSLRICSICSKAIFSRPICVENNGSGSIDGNSFFFYHDDCFRCAVCSLNLNEDIYVSFEVCQTSGKIYCQKHVSLMPTSNLDSIHQMPLVEDPPPELEDDIEALTLEPSAPEVKPSAKGFEPPKSPESPKTAPSPAGFNRPRLPEKKNNIPRSPSPLMNAPSSPNLRPANVPILSQERIAASLCLPSEPFSASSSMSSKSSPSSSPSSSPPSSPTSKSNNSITPFKSAEPRNSLKVPLKSSNLIGTSTIKPPPKPITPNFLAPSHYSTGAYPFSPPPPLPSCFFRAPPSSDDNGSHEEHEEEGEADPKKMAKKHPLGPQNTDGPSFDSRHVALMFSCGLNASLKETDPMFAKNGSVKGFSISPDYRAKNVYRLQIVLPMCINPPNPNQHTDGGNINPREDNVKCSFVMQDYSPRMFAMIRRQYGISNELFRTSLVDTHPRGGQQGQWGGKSGQLFFFSADSRFVIKTVTRSEFHFFRSALLRDYHQHMEKHPHTLLPRFYGLVKIAAACVSGASSSSSTSSFQPVRLIIMNQVFYSPMTAPYMKFKQTLDSFCTDSSNTTSEYEAKQEECLQELDRVVPNFAQRPLTQYHKFDLKGSTRNRFVRDLKSAGGVYKDLNLVYADIPGESSATHHPTAGGVQPRIHLGVSQKAALFQQLAQDQSWLSRHNIMDHSLLVGIHYDTDAELAQMYQQQPTLKGGGMLPSLVQYPMGAVQLSHPLYSCSSVLSSTQQGKNAAYSPELFSAFQLHRGGLRSFDNTATRPLRSVYSIAVIDILQEFDLKKKIESAYKGLKYNRAAISAIESRGYGERFLNFLGEIID